MDYQWSNLRDFLQTNVQEVRERSYSNYNLIFYTQKEIEDITNGYSTVLGEGGFGMVYKGILDDQRPVAVKRFKNETKKEDFAKEVTVHSQINHKNVVRLLGCCTEDNALMIVMEFICNGNLYNMLHGSNEAGLVPFPLEKRLDIAVESAEALSCMHSMYSPVLHGDIKPANILLDENCLPKISDFGIARLLSTGDAQHTETVIGPIGYMDPLYINSGKLTPKSDVYSFGVVLLEIITRKKAVDGNTILTQSFNEAFGKGKKVRHLFDEKISSGKKNTKLLEDVAKLAIECLRWNDNLRPQMIEVGDRLRMIRKALHKLRGRHSAGFSGSNYVDPSSKTPPTSPIITLDKLKSVSKNLMPPDVLGCVPYTTFFLGTTGGNRCVIKKLDASLFEEFQDQVPIISKLKHENVVHLFGHFVEGNVHVLAYEYATMGSLHDGIRRRALSWKQRVKIVLTAAKGLEFLHEKAEPPIIHK
ncbi:putative wall-associated receptor kinase-like 16, partial [Lolium rigidum]|uniref:putative wall-associated receptor kinase-like 16 n=1 Tax=Lolium rigidum TaxID=89674 RepID=UPI001F5DC22C